MELSKENILELKVFFNHIYEYKKGVRQMVLYTMSQKYESYAVNRLKEQGIAHYILPAGKNTINLFFGKCECIQVIKLLIDGSLSQLSPEKDFILGSLLGYDVCTQCTRYCEQLKRKSA